VANRRTISAIGSTSSIGIRELSRAPDTMAGFAIGRAAGAAGGFGGVVPPGERSGGASPRKITGELAQVEDLEQRVAPAVVGGPGVEAAQALIGRVEHGREDGVVNGELAIVSLRGISCRKRAARQGGPVTLEDVCGAPRHREPQGLGEQQVLRAGSVKHSSPPSPQESGGRQAAAGTRSDPVRLRAVTP